MRKSNGARIASHRDLDAWRLAMEIVVDVYRATRAFPAEEKFGLVAQLRRAAVSIPSNLAEGRGRLGTGEFRRFVSIARGSTAEVETQLDVAVALAFAGASEIAQLLAKLDRLSKMLFGLYRSLGRTGDGRRATGDG